MATLKRAVWGVPVSTLLVPALCVAAVLVLQALPPSQWVHEPLHSTVEATGAVLAVSLALLLGWRQTLKADAPHLVWLMASFTAMGLMDLGHAVVRVGPPFFWSRALPTLLGGLLAALVLAPAAWSAAPALRRLPGWAAAGAVLLAVAFIAVPGMWPPAFGETGTYRGWAKAINVVGGLAFLAASARFVARYRRSGDYEDELFATQCTLFGVAGVLFGLSRLWDPVWWLFHFLRLAAYLVVAWHVVNILRVAQARQRDQMVQELSAQLADLDEMRRRMVAGEPRPGA